MAFCVRKSSAFLMTIPMGFSSFRLMMAMDPPKIEISDSKWNSLGDIRNVSRSFSLNFFGKNRDRKFSDSGVHGAINRVLILFLIRFLKCSLRRNSGKNSTIFPKFAKLTISPPFCSVIISKIFLIPDFPSKS